MARNVWSFFLGLLLVKQASAACGEISSVLPRILDGFVALPCSAPWHTHVHFVDEAINIANPATTNDNMACSAVIINRAYALISPTCMFFVRTNLTTAMQTMVLAAGDIDITQTEGTEQYRRPTEIYMHPDYPFRTQQQMQDAVSAAGNFNWYQDYQAAIVKVDPPFEFQNCVNEICLPNLDDAQCSFEDCILSANGLTSLSPTVGRPNVTQIAKISHIPRAGCNALARSLPGFRIPLAGSCARSESSSIPCVNDAGGPLACSINGINYLRGTSIADFCNVLAPPLFWDATLADSLRFMNNVIAQNSIPETW